MKKLRVGFSFMHQRIMRSCLQALVFADQQDVASRSNCLHCCYSNFAELCDRTHLEIVREDHPIELHLFSKHSAQHCRAKCGWVLWINTRHHEVSRHESVDASVNCGSEWHKFSALEPPR